MWTTRTLGLFAVAATLLGGGRAQAAGTPLAIVVTDRDNLQDLPLFVALGAGYFRDDGLDVTLSVAPTPGDVFAMLHPDADQVAVLPPPVYLQMISEKFPLVVVGNLLQNDPIEVIVSGRVAAERHLSATAPLPERLRALSGLRMGVAPGPINRLRALYRSQGLDADSLLQLVTLPGPKQNDAFAAGKVDALYAHTPFLEKALVEQQAVLLVNQSAGVVPALSARLIHAVVATRGFIAHRPDDVKRVVAAIARAETLVRRDRAAAARAVATALPDRPVRWIERLLEIYQPAVPATPDVDAAGLRGALALFPASKKAPDLSGVDLAPYVDNRWAKATHGGAR